MEGLRQDTLRNSRKASYRAPDPRRISKIGLLEENLDGSCSFLPFADTYNSPTVLPLQPLDPAILLRKCSVNQKTVTNIANEKSFQKSRLNADGNSLHGGEGCGISGIDNDVFTVECLSAAMPGCRRPFIGVDVRTLSREQEIVSALCHNSADLRAAGHESGCSGSLGKLNSPVASPITNNDSATSQDYEQRNISAGLLLLPQKNTISSGAGDKVNTCKPCYDRVGTPRPKGKLFRDLRRGRPSSILTRNVPELSSSHHSVTMDANRRMKNKDLIRKRLSGLVINNEFVSDSESSEYSSSEDTAGSSTTAALPYSGGCGTISSQKTELVMEKKTDSGSQWCDQPGTVSVTRDMVQVGGVSRPSAGQYTNSISVSNNNRVPYVSNNVNTIAVSASVSVRNSALLSPVRTAGKVSNIVCGSSSITTTPTVSALTKVSSVRIVPTPTPTPTPSVTGTTSENGSTKLAPPPQRAPFKQNLQESLRHSSSAIARPSHNKQPESAEASGSSGAAHSTISPPSVLSSIIQRGFNDTSSVSPLKQTSNNVQQRTLQQNLLVTTSTTTASVVATTQTSTSKPAENILSSSSSNVNNFAGNNLQGNNSQPITTSVSTTSVNQDASTTNPQLITRPPATSNETDVDPRRGERERRRERRERRRERRAQRLSGAVLLPPPPPTTTAQTEITAENPSNTTNPPNSRLPDLLNSHVPPPYSTLPSGGRTHGGLMGPPPPGPIPPGSIAPGPPPPIPIHVQHPPPGAPLPPGYPPPPTPGSPIRPPPDCPWLFFGSRRYLII